MVPSDVIRVEDPEPAPELGLVEGHRAGSQLQDALLLDVDASPVLAGLVPADGAVRHEEVAGGVLEPAALSSSLTGRRGRPAGVVRQNRQNRPPW